jgi:sugar lactone lactonase YvrE
MFGRDMTHPWPAERLEKRGVREGISLETTLSIVKSKNTPDIVRRRIVMKSASRRTRFAAAVLCLFAFASATYGATLPPNGPQGLALDAKGNLYVANRGGNDVLIYSPAYAQATSKTIKKDVIQPAAVAIDGSGNVWVGNTAGGPSRFGSVTVYSATGVEDTTRTITAGIDTPIAIAVDGIGDIWVENNFNSLTVYPTLESPMYPISKHDFTFPVTGIATHNQWVAVGENNTLTAVNEISMFLFGAGQVTREVYGPAYALAYDNEGNLYTGNLSSPFTLTVSEPSYTTTTTLATVSYFPAGIAVDSVRKRIYVSDLNNNQIHVYSTSGVLLKTIQ